MEADTFVTQAPTSEMIEARRYQAIAVANCLHARIAKRSLAYEKTAEDVGVYFLGEHERQAFVSACALLNSVFVRSME